MEDEAGVENQKKHRDNSTIENNQRSQNEALKGEKSVDDVNDRSELSFDTILKELGEEDKSEAHVETERVQNYASVNCIPEEVEKLAEDSSTKDQQTICPEEGLVPNQEENKHMVDGGEIKTQETLNQTILLSMAGEIPVEESLKQGEWDTERLQQETEHFNTEDTERNHEAMDSEEVAREPCAEPANSRKIEEDALGTIGSSVATEANEVENEQLEVVPVERKEEDPIRGIIHKDQEAEKINDMLQESENYVTNNDILTRSAIEQTNEVSTVKNEASKKTDEAADKFEISSIAKEDHVAAQPAEEVETSKVISSKADGDSKESNEQETGVGELSKVNNTVSHMEKLREDGELNPANGTTTDHKKNDVFATTETGTDRSENNDKKPIEEETVEEAKHDATPVQTENDNPAEEETAARHIEKMTREQEIHEKDYELLFAATKNDVETTTAISTKIEDENIIEKLSPMIDTNTCPDNLTATETLAQYNVSEGKPVHPEIKITADCEENKDVALEDTSADNESAKIPSENEDATPDQTEKDCPAEEEKGEMHIEETTREPELKENAAQLLPKTTKADVSYSDEKVEASNFISPKIDEEENVVRKFSPVNDTNTYLDNLASRESPETLKECKIPEGNPVDAESINKQMPIEVELAEEPIQHATPDKKENDLAEAESGRWHVVETSRELELQEETDELLTGTKKMQREDEYVEEQCQDETLEQTEIDCSAEEETRGRHAEGKNRELELSEETDELLSGNTKTDVISLKEDETVEHCRGTTPDQTENGCPAEEDMGESHVEEETKELELQEEADGLQSKVQVETFKDMSPKNYEEENIVEKFSTMNVTSTHVQNLTSAASPETLMKYNDSSEKPSNQDKKNTVDYEKSHDVSMEDMSADTSKHSKMPSEEEIVEEPSQDATLCNKEKYSPAEEEMGTRHVNTATEEFQQEADELLAGATRTDAEPLNEKVETSKVIFPQIHEEENIQRRLSLGYEANTYLDSQTSTEAPETLMGYKFSDENLVKPDKITIVDHEKNDVGVVEDMTADTSENAKLPSEDKAVEGPCRDATPHQIEIDCSAKEETRERHAKENTRELELSEVADGLLRGTTNIDASSLKEEVQTSKVLSANIDEENIFGKLSPVNDANTYLFNLTSTESPENLMEFNVYEGGNPVKRDNKINTDHESSSITKEEHLAAQPAEETDKKGLELKAKDLDFNMAEKGENSNVISSNADEHSKAFNEQETIVGDLSKVNNIVTHLENLTLRESPEQLREHSELTPANGTTTTHRKTDDFVMTETGADRRENDDKKPREDCNVEDETAGRHIEEITREPELHEKDDELLSGARKTDVETSKAISTKIGEDENITGKLSPTKETNTKLDNLTPAETLETLEQYNVSEGKPVNPENKISASCEKSKDVALEDMSADQESAKIPSEDENVEVQNKDETPDQTEHDCPAEDEKGERHIEETTRESKLQEEDDALLFKTTKAGVSYADEKMPIENEAVEEPPQHATLEKTENDPAEGRYVKGTTREQEIQEEADESLIGRKKTDLGSSNIDEEENNTGKLSLVNDTNNAGTRENAKIPSEDENIEEQCQDETLEKREFDRSAEEETRERHAKEITRELELQEEADELPMATKTNADVGSSDEKVETFKDMSPKNYEDENIDHKLSEVEPAEEPLQHATPDKKENDPEEAESGRQHVVETSRELELQEEADELLIGTKKMPSEEEIVEEPRQDATLCNKEKYSHVEEEMGTRHVNTATEEFQQETLMEYKFSDENLVKPDKITVVDQEKNDVSVEDMTADTSENAKLPSEEKAVEGPCRDATPRQIEIDCSAKEETRERHAKENTSELELSEVADELLRGTTNIDVNSLKEEVETSTVISSNADEGTPVNPGNKTSAGCEKNKDVALEDMSADQESAKMPIEDEAVEESPQQATLEKTENDPAKGRYVKETTREQEIQEEADEPLIGTKKTDLGSVYEKVEISKFISPNIDEEENNTGKLSFVNDTNNAGTRENAKIPSEDENIEEQCQDETLEKSEFDRSAEEETRERHAKEITREADGLPITTKTDADVGSSDEKVETFKDMSPQNYEDENIVQKLSPTNDANTNVNDLTSTASAEIVLEYNISTEKTANQDNKNIADFEKDNNAKMPSEEDTVEGPYSPAEIETATRHVDRTTEEFHEKVTSKVIFPTFDEEENVPEKLSQVNDTNTYLDSQTSTEAPETLTGHTFSGEKLVKPDKITIVDHEKNIVGVEDMSADTSENAKMPYQDATPHQTEIDCSAEAETRRRHDKEKTRELELSEEADELLRGTTNTDVSSLEEQVETSKVLSPKIDEEENTFGKLSPMKDTNTYLYNLPSIESPKKSMEYNVYDRGNQINRDSKINTDHEKNVNVAPEDMSTDTSKSSKMPGEDENVERFQRSTLDQTENGCPAEEDAGTKHAKEKTKELELQEEAEKLQTGTAKTDLGSSIEKGETSMVMSPKNYEEENIVRKLSPVNDTNSYPDNLTPTASPDTLMEYNSPAEKPENQDKKNIADHEKNDNAAIEEMSADTSENAKMPCEIEAVEEPIQDATPGKKETDCPAEEETGTRHVKTTRDELHEEADELITAMNRSDIGSLNEKVQTSKAVLLKIDEEENVLGNLSLVNDTNTYLDSQTSTIAPITLRESNVSEGMPIKLDKRNIADNEKNIDVGIEDMSSDTSENTKIQMPSEAQTVDGLSMDATLHQTENDCLTEDETGRRPDKEPTRELVFQEVADDLLLGTTKAGVSSLNEKIETSTTISPKIYEEGNVVGKLSLVNDTNRHVDNLTSQQSPEILMEYDTITIGGQEKNDNANMEDMSADTGDNAKGIEKQIPREDKSVGEPCRDATVDQIGKHGHAEEETNGRHVKETTRRLEIQQEDHDLLTEATKTEARSSKEKIDISKVMPPKTDEGSKVSIDQENIADECQQARNKSTYMDNLASRESPENSIEYSVFEGQAGSPENKPTSDQEKNNDVALADVNPLSLVESEKPRNPIDEFSCNSTSFTRDSNFEDQEDSAEGDDNHKGEECKRTGKMEDHTVTQLESKEEAFSKENETSSEVDSMQQQNEENAKLPTAILGRNVQAEKEEVQSVSSSKIVPESKEVKHEKDERKPDESKNITEKCLSMESDLISKSSLNETSTEEILQATENRENQNPCEDSPIDIVEHVAQALTKPNDTESQLKVQGPTDGVQQEMETLDSLYAFKSVLGAKGEYHKDDNFINDCNIKTGGLESITCPQSSAQSNKEIPKEQDKEGALDEPESFHVSSDSNELVTSHDAILNASCGNDVKMPLEVQKPKEESLPNYSSSTSTNVLNLHQKVSADISLSEEDNTEQGKIVQEEVISREGKGKTKASVSDNLQVPRKGISVLEEDVKPKSQQISLKEEFEDGKTKSVESVGQKTDQDEETKVESSDDIPVTVEIPSISDDKPAQKKSHSILSGVGSKVKHSIAKVKKVITGKHSNQKPAPSI